MKDRVLELATGANDAAAQEHVRTCSTCAAEVESFRRTMALLDEWQAPEPTPYFDVRLRARMREECAQEPQDWLTRLGWHRAPAVAFALMVLMAVGISVFQNGDRQPPTNPPVIAANHQPPKAGAVADLQALDRDEEMYADFDELDDINVHQTAQNF